MAQHGNPKANIVKLFCFFFQQDRSWDIPEMTVRFPSSTTSGSRDKEESITFPSMSRPYTNYNFYLYVHEE